MLAGGGGTARFGTWLAAGLLIGGIGVGGSYLAFDVQRSQLIADTSQTMELSRDAFARAVQGVFQPALTLSLMVAEAGLDRMPAFVQSDVFFAIATGPVREFRQLNGAFLGFPDGRFLQVTDLPLPGVVTTQSALANPELLRRRIIDAPEIDAVGRWDLYDPDRGIWVGKPDLQTAPFDPRQRPWYTLALERGEPAWTSAYVFASSGKLGVTLSTPVYDSTGRLWAVLGIDMSLGTLSEVLLDTAQILQSVGDVVFATDLANQILAHPDLLSGGTALEAGTAALLERYNDPAQLESALMRAVGTTGRVESVLANGMPFLASKARLDSDTAMPLQIFVARDLNRVLAAARADMYRNGFLAFLACVVFGVVAVYAVKLRVEVTARKRAEEEVREARDVAEAATKAKSVFLATMSHEIRTPMNGITSMVELLGLTRLDAEQRRMARIVQDSAESLLTIINDILDFSKIEAGKLDIERVAFSLQEVVDGSAELLAPRADAKALDLTVEIDPTLVDMRLGDPTRLRQVLLNLGGNAVKFTSEGGVHIAVRADPEIPGGLIFRVRDTGIGLTEEQRGKLFQPFVQADNSTSRRFGGTGLGLSISRTLVELMGGRIGVDSEEGVGSEFWFALPMQAEGAVVPRHPEDLSAARVALVGLSGTHAGIARAYLMATGIPEPAILPSLEASVGVEADLWLIHAPAPEVTPETLDHLPGTKALVLGRGALAGLDPALRGRAATLLTFPLSRAPLWRAAAIALGLESADATDAEARDDLSHAPPPREEAAAARAVILVAEDNPTNQVVIRQLLGRMGLACDIAEHGMAALSMLDRDAHGLLLTDFNMPVMDGFELTRAVRETEREKGLERLPVIALTADAIAGTEDACLMAGMDGYLTKPIDSRKLGETLHRYLPQALPLRRPAVAADAPAPEAEAGAPSGPDWDPDIFDPTVLAVSFGAFDAEAKALVDSAALAWREKVATVLSALAAGDAPLARDAAHALKGSALSVGATRLGRLAGDVQDALDDNDSDTASLMAEVLEPTLTEFEETLPAIRAA